MTAAGRGLIVAAACAALLQTPPVAADDAIVAAIDPVESTALFHIRHFLIDRVTGTVPILQGEVRLVPGSLLPRSVTAVLDAAHVHTGIADRDRSLAGPAYFDATLFPTWTFTSTRIVTVGPAAFALDGMLMIHGVAQPEHLDVTIGGNAAHPTYHAVGYIDRHAFGMKGEGIDAIIGNDAQITLDIILTAPSAAAAK